MLLTSLGKIFKVFYHLLPWQNSNNIHLVWCMVHNDERPFIEPFTEFLNAVPVPFFTKKLNAIHAIVHDFECRSERRSLRPCLLINSGGSDGRASSRASCPLVRNISKEGSARPKLDMSMSESSTSPNEP